MKTQISNQLLWVYCYEINIEKELEQRDAIQTALLLSFGCSDYFFRAVREA